MAVAANQNMAVGFVGFRPAHGHHHVAAASQGSTWLLVKEMKLQTRTPGTCVRSSYRAASSGG